MGGPFLEDALVRGLSGRFQVSAPDATELVDKRLQLAARIDLVPLEHGLIFQVVH